MGTKVRRPKTQTKMCAHCKRRRARLKIEWHPGIQEWQCSDFATCDVAIERNRPVCTFHQLKDRLARTIHQSPAGLVKCDNCVRGFRRVDGVHIGSQRLRMIPNTPCDRVFAIHGGNMTDDNNRPWMAYVDGAPVRKKSGDARRFATSEAAYAAARKAAPRRWHP